jgi:hypothetical protein
VFQAEWWFKAILLMQLEISRALGIKFSWRVLFRANQIWSQATAANIWKRCEYEAGIPIISGCRIIDNQSDKESIRRARLSKGQKEFLQTTLAIGQEKNKCNRESLGKEQREQEISVGAEGMQHEIRDFVGRIFQPIFQRSKRKRWLSLSFQSDFQVAEGRGEMGTVRPDVIRWWVDLMEKTPEGEGVQRRELLIRRMSIFKISQTVAGVNSLQIQCKFQLPVEWQIRSARVILYK